MGVGIQIFGKKKDGEEFPIQVSLNQLDVGHQKLTMCLVSDITIREAVIWALQREKDVAQMYLDVAGTMFVLINQYEKVALINQKGCTVLGYQEADILGKNWFDHFIPEQQREQVRHVFQQLMKEPHGEFRYYQNPILTKNGETRLIAWNNTLIKDDEGNVTGTLSSGEDITEQSLANEKLKKLNSELERRVVERTKALEDSQHIYKMIARNFPNGDISVFDKHLNYVFIEGMEMHKRGINGSMLVGTSFLDRVNKEVREGIGKKLMEVFQGKDANFELKLQERTYLVNAVGLRDTNNEINQILMVSQNITNLKRAEENILRSLEKERHLNELKSRFVSMASHEFRTPLTTIMNSASLLSKYIGKDNVEEKEIKHVKRIKSSVEHLTGILNDFLSLDKLEEGKVEVHATPLDLPDFLKGLVAEMDDIAMDDKHIIYNHSGKRSVVIDKQIIKTILTNLLSNALKYSFSKGHVQFMTFASDSTLTIIVKDSGIGIPSEEQQHLFEQFFRAKNVLNIQGTGLGLYIVKKYLDMVGGVITFHSVEQVGTTFRIEIPLSKISAETLNTPPNDKTQLIH